MNRSERGGTGGYTKILVAMTPDTSPETLADAARLAARHGAALIALSCVELPTDRAALAGALGFPAEELAERLLEDSRRRLDATIAEAGLTGRLTTELRLGKSYVETIRYVLSEGVDLVIKTAEPLSGVQRFLFASTDHHLVRKCPCPVWLQTPEAAKPPRRIIAAVDVDEWDASEPETLHDLNQHVLETALNLAQGQEAVIYALHAWDAVGEGLIWAFASGGDARQATDAYTTRIQVARTRALDRLTAQFLPPPGAGPAPQIVPRLARGPADRVIAEEVEKLQPDLLVLGTVARTGVSGVIIGNTAEDILNRVDCSIAAVKPRSFKCPLDAGP